MTGTAFPTALAGKIARFRLDLNENVSQTQSLFTRQRQVVTLSGGTSDRWEGIVETVPLLPADVKTMWGFLNAVGLYGQFNMLEPDYAGAASGATTGAVQGASQSGTALVVDGLALSTTIIRAGEYFQVRDEFKLATQDGTTNGSGVVTLHFKPALRVSPADNDVVTFNSPRLLLHLTSTPSKDTDTLGMAAFTLSFEEVLVTS